VISGRFYDGESSRVSRARAELDVAGTLRVFVVDGLGTDGAARVLECPLADVEISERIADIPRRLTLPGAGVFETPDNGGVDGMLEPRGERPGIVHWLEQRWPVAIASLAAVAIGSVLFVWLGVPVLSDFVARSLPASFDAALGAESLELLDRIAFEPSTLDGARRTELTARFEAIVTEQQSQADDARAGAPRPRFELRSAPRLGPNALALPSGIVVMTDELVALAEHDDELVAVMAHELGHVRGRHTLRHIVQSAGVSALALALLGDVGTAAGLLGLAPVLLDAKHSRDFEREADAFAREWLARHWIAPDRFDDILCRMEAEAGGDGDATVARFLSTHPATDERARCA